MDLGGPAIAYAALSLVALGVTPAAANAITHWTAGAATREMLPVHRAAQKRGDLLSRVLVNYDRSVSMSASFLPSLGKDLMAMLACLLPAL
jgi:hypothetical protein